MTHRSPYASAAERSIAFRRSELAREAFSLWFRWTKAIVPGRSIGFALLGDSLFSIAKKISKNACPCIRVSLRETSLIPSLLRGSPPKGHPWPFTALAASMPLAPLRSDSIRPPERGVRRRLVVRAMKRQEAVSSQLVGWVQPINHGRWASPILRLSTALQSISAFNGIQTTCTQTPIPPMRSGSVSYLSSVGWKTAKHFPPQSSPRWISNPAREKRWVSFALPTLHIAAATASLHAPSDTAELPLSQGRAQHLVGWVQPINRGRWASPILCSDTSTVRQRHTPLSGGRAQVAWKGLSGMDAARELGVPLTMGQGWPFAAGPWNVTGARGPRRSRGRMQGQDFLVPFGGAAIRATAKRDSPSRAKPMLQATQPIGRTSRSPNPKASRASSLLLPQPTTTKSYYTRGQSHYRLAAACSGCITSQVPQC